MSYNVKVLGFGDNVVDKYEHIKTMYPGSKEAGRRAQRLYGYFRL